MKQTSAFVISEFTNPSGETAYPLEKFPLVAGNFQQRCSALRDKFNLSHDVMRHTFISMFVGKFRSIGEAAIQAGNSESIAKKRPAR